MLSADIRAEGVSGLVPNPFGIAANTDTSYYFTPPQFRFEKNLNKSASTQKKPPKHIYSLAAEISYHHPQ